MLFIMVSVWKMEVKMGTYTTNYNLFMPTVGEQGWGTLVNGNFATIDTTMKRLDTRLTAVESEVNGNLSCTSVTTSGTITSAGKITGNGGIGTTSLTTSGTITSTGKITANGGLAVTGGITSDLTGNVYGRLYVNGNISTSGEYVYATCNEQSYTYTQSYNNSTMSNVLTVVNYSIKSLSYPLKIAPGVYIKDNSYISGSNPSTSTRTINITANTWGSTTGYVNVYIYKNDSLIVNKDSLKAMQSKTYTYTTNVGDRWKGYIYQNVDSSSLTFTVTALPTYYINAS